MATNPDSSRVEGTLRESTVTPSCASILRSSNSSRLPDIPSVERRSFLIDGEPAICFPKKVLNKEHNLMSAHLGILKFSYQMPGLATIRSYLTSDWNVNGDFHMSLMDLGHVAIWFEREMELDLALAKNNRYVRGITCKIFRWRPGFSTRYAPRMVPVWLELPNLAYEYFAPSILKVIGDDLGHYLAMDKATYNRSNTGTTRICVEMDMDYDLLERIYLQCGEDPDLPAYWQPIKYPRFLYCSYYQMVGHSYEHCKKHRSKKVDNERRQESIGREEAPEISNSNQVRTTEGQRTNNPRPQINKHKIGGIIGEAGKHGSQVGEG